MKFFDFQLPRYQNSALYPPLLYFKKFEKIFVLFRDYVKILKVFNVKFWKSFTEIAKK